MLFQGYRVLDLSDEKGAYAGRLLADLGAEVIKVEPPEGDRLRRMPPFLGDRIGDDRSLAFVFYHLNKRSITLDLQHGDAAPILKELARGADVVIESFEPGYLDGLGLGYAALSGLNPGLVFASVTPFGQHGPWGGFKSSDLVNMALGGVMQITGQPGAAPLRLGINHSYLMAALHAASGIGVALWHREEHSGRGQHLDLSVHEATAILGLDSGQAPTWYILNENPVRTGGQYAALFPAGPYLVQDGWVMIIILTAAEWDRFSRWVCEVTGDQEWLDPMYQGGGHARAEYKDFLEVMLESDFFPRFTKARFVEEGQKRDLCTLPVYTIEDLAHDAQLDHRGFFQNVTLPSGEGARLFRPPVHLPGWSWQARRMAATPGQDNAEVYGEMGLSRDDLSVLKGLGVV